MKLIVGLGNPGEKYQYNRHNVGFVVVERLLAEIINHQTSIIKQDQNFEFNKKFNAEMVTTKEYILAKPQTFMNESGVSVAAIARFYKLKSDDIYVIHDDLDIALGSYKIVHSKGPHVHNGLLSIYEKLGSKNFWHVRVGVENREVRGNTGVPGMVYSLQNFTPEEQPKVETVVEQIVKALMISLG